LRSFSHASLARWRELDVYLLQADAKLFGDEHRQRRVDTLTHLGAVAQEGDAVVGADAQPGVRLHRFRRAARRLLGATASGQIQRHHETARECGGALEKVTPGKTHEDPLQVLDLSCAARWMAARIRW
jgi:hypothetical protein